MERPGEDGRESPRIDVNSLPDSVVRLWETMLRLDPNWKLTDWLDERANEEMELVESHLGREKMRLEQRLHRIETLVKKLKRQREVTNQSLMNDPLQKNLFDVFDGKSEKNERVLNSEPLEADMPAVAMGIMGDSDDPILAIVAEHVLSTIEIANLEKAEPVHFDQLITTLGSIGISVEEIDEAVGFLLQCDAIVELEQDIFGLN
ncbi:MAG: hypothetical protein QF365_04855 [Candidatus Thalassarchaeaceae archaeon]|jgi:hypothetical protein|nr:hypothetical protein [Candidatus Thalassarchaeaceae archaeon]MDP6317834.1 hypothetical protein [Candidatus Thalassarchaeaceae archaeon]DAC34549.1 MAG TPA: hypothetical protein D7H79_03965 [Candidatus Poseidoniales archaeon]HIH80367.1 hypothetical protein [Candidatus Thalassarchaeaceae archaeon]